MSCRLLLSAVLVVGSGLPAFGQADATEYILPPLASREAVDYLLSAKAEDRDLRPVTRFLEESWVLFGGPSQILETQIAPHLQPFQKPASAWDRLYGGWFFDVAVTPMVRVRILKERSAPVRTPSFMPKATFQAFHLESRSPGVPWERAVNLWNLQVTVGHHSNGQDGCTFEGADPPDCVGYDPDNIVINRVNGSFSTNYIRAGANVRRIWLEKAGGYQTDFRALAAGVSYETHPSWFSQIGGVLEDEVRPAFGVHRLRAYVEYKFPSKRLYLWGAEGFETRVRAWGQWSSKTRDTADCGIPGAGGVFGDPCASKLGWGVEVFRPLANRKQNRAAKAWVDEIALYARYHHAQDYYNLAFSHNYNTFQVGLAFDVGRSEPVRLPDLQQSALLGEENAVLQSNPHDHEGAWELYRRQNRHYFRAVRSFASRYLKALDDGGPERVAELLAKDVSKARGERQLALQRVSRIVAQYKDSPHELGLELEELANPR